MSAPLAHRQLRWVSLLQLNLKHCGFVQDILTQTLGDVVIVYEQFENVYWKAAICVCRNSQILQTPSR